MSENQNPMHEPAPGAGPSDELTVAQRQLNVLRDKIRNLDKQLASATINNSRLMAMLETAKSEIVRLKDALER
ncbi:proteasome ATPase, partial [Arthrobacter deserti]|nr:proteasome ATPase [Arthrobacter deserti]